MRLYVLGLLTLLLLVNEPKTANGICNIIKNGTQARCQYIEDINSLHINELKNLKISVIEKYLSVDSFNNLKNLRHLVLSNGKLRKLKTGIFINLRELRSLDLSNNHLHHLEQGTFDGLLHLRHLNLRRNSLDRIPSDTNNMKNLLHLDLADNKLICDCVTLKERDSLRGRGVNITKETYCAGPGNLKGVLFSKPEAENICMFEKQEQEDGMQGDEPVKNLLEGSGEADPFDEIEDTDVPDDEEKNQETSTISTTEKIQETTIITEIPLTLEPTVSSKDDGIYFSEEDKLKISSTTTLPFTEAPEEEKKDDELLNKEKNTDEGSGGEEDDFDDGSGIEGSGVGHVPPIDWASVAETTSDNPETPQPPKTTESSFWPLSFFNIFATTTSNETIITSTESSILSSTIDDINLAQEELLPVSPPTESPELPSTTTTTTTEINPTVLKINPNESAKIRIIDNKKSVDGEVEIVNDSNELPDASSAIQAKKSVGSYLVLAVLLIVLATLIGFAAYRGDFCNNERKRNIRNPDIADVENGTELKDLTKSLLDGNNTNIQPKISTKNGNKHETIPLVVNDDNNKINTKNDSEPTAKYIGAVSDSTADPIKPPRKSYSPNEQDNDTNDCINDQCSRQKNGQDVLVNGKHDRDSLSSGSLSNQLNSHGLIPSSPGAQRVKITLQDNPDSIPKTPLLITKIKGGENLVKTSP